MDINSDNINNMPTKFFDDEHIQYRSLDDRNRTPGYWGLLQDANIRYESTIEDETLLKLGKRINQSETELKTQRQNRIRTLIRNRLEHESIARNSLERENIFPDRLEQENILIRNRLEHESIARNRLERENIFPDRLEQE